MTTRSNPMTEPKPRQHIGPFSEPGTTPVNWEVSGLLSASPASRPDSHLISDSEASTPASGGQATISDAEPKWPMDPYDEPRTFLTHWDLSMLE